jgi:hypothetical protein
MPQVAQTSVCGFLKVAPPNAPHAKKTNLPSHTPADQQPNRLQKKQFILSLGAKRGLSFFPNLKKKQIPRANRALGMTLSGFFRNLFEALPYKNSANFELSAPMQPMRESAGNPPDAAQHIKLRRCA